MHQEYQKLLDAEKGAPRSDLEINLRKAYYQITMDSGEIIETEKVKGVVVRAEIVRSYIPTFNCFRRAARFRTAKEVLASKVYNLDGTSKLIEINNNIFINRSKIEIMKLKIEDYWEKKILTNKEWTEISYSCNKEIRINNET